MFWHKIKHNLNHQTKPKIKVPDNYLLKMAWLAMNLQ